VLLVRTNNQVSVVKLPRFAYDLTEQMQILAGKPDYKQFQYKEVAITIRMPARSHRLQLVALSKPQPPCNADWVMTPANHQHVHAK
jgi:hypothetical protein